MNLLSLRIEAPVANIQASRGFYQVEEDLLIVPVVVGDSETKPRRFFSYIESKFLRLDMDRMGELLQIEISQPRRQWQVDSNIHLPLIVENADIHWLDFRTKIKVPEIFTNEKKDILALSFGKSENNLKWYRLADSIYIQADYQNKLHSIMISQIEDDMAGKKLSEFRGGLAPFGTIFL